MRNTFLWDYMICSDFTIPIDLYIFVLCQFYGNFRNEVKGDEISKHIRLFDEKNL